MSSSNFKRPNQLLITQLEQYFVLIQIASYDEERRSGQNLV